MPNQKTLLYLITQSDWGGAQKYVFDLACGLKNEYNIIVAGGEQGEAGELAQKLKAENIKFIPLKHVKRAILPIQDFLAIFELVKLIKKTRPEIIHLNSSKVSIVGTIASFIAKHFIWNLEFGAWNLIYTVHGWVFNEPMPAWKKLFYKYAEKLTARWKDKLICVSEFDRQAAIKENICPTSKLVTIHNGIKPVDFLSKEEARKHLTPQPPLLAEERGRIAPLSSARRGAGLPVEALAKAGREVWIGSIGNLYKTKGFEYFIEAAAIMRGRGLDFYAVIIGSGSEKEALESLIAQKKLSDIINFVEIKSGAARYLKAFDIYFSSSVKEGLAYTIVEAMQAGLPIVATRVGGTPEMIEDGVTGILAESKNPEDLAEKILTLATDEALRVKLSSTAIKKAETEFSLETMIRATKNEYTARITNNNL